MKKQTIKVYVEGGVVTEVANLPIDCDYEIIDHDEIKARLEDKERELNNEKNTI
jgi:hypothetical protein